MTGMKNAARLSVYAVKSSKTLGKNQAVYLARRRGHHVQHAEGEEYAFNESRIQGLRHPIGQTRCGVPPRHSWERGLPARERPAGVSAGGLIRRSP